MQEVSKDQGRTVLFVSHNMDAIQRLCSQCVMLERGRVTAQGDTHSIVMRYMSNNSTIQASPNEWIDVSQVNRRIVSREAHLVAVQYSSVNEAVAFQPYSNGALEFLLAIESDSVRAIGSIAVTIYDKFGTKLVNADSLSLGEIITLEKGKNIVKIRIKKLYLNSGIYIVGWWVSDPLIGTVFDFAESAFEIQVINLQAESLGIKPEADGFVICDVEFLRV